MKTGTKEFYQIIASFEKAVIEGIVNCSADFRKEDSSLNKHGAFYCNGEVNKMFHVYMLGYSAGRIEYMN